MNHLRFNNFLTKLRESFFSILPIFILVIILHFSNISHLENATFRHFIISFLIIVVSMALFSYGCESSMIVIGGTITSTLISKRKVFLLIGMSLVFGFLITIAEPDLNVLTGLLKGSVDGKLIIYTIAIGVGLFLTLAVLRVFLKIRLKYLLLLMYALVFILASIAPHNLLAVCFDSGGVTTGPITSPFILALGLGIASVTNSNKGEGNFGFVGLCSVGPILAMLILSLFYPNATLNSYNMEDLSYIELIKNHSLSVGISIFVILGTFLILDIFFLKIKFKKLLSIFLGLIFSYIGLVFFLSAVEYGFLETGTEIGKILGSKANTQNSFKLILILITFIIGLLVVLAEPAVHTLNNMIDKTSNGVISKKNMLISLSIGVGIAVSLAAIRLIFDIDFIFIIGIGYGLVLILSTIIDDVYVGIAFDSGGVASGPLSSSFILPLMIGICSSLNKDILSGGFGVVALIALTPLITIQTLGLISKIKNKTIKIKTVDDYEIIRFK